MNPKARRMRDMLKSRIVLTDSVIDNDKPDHLETTKLRNQQQIMEALRLLLADMI